MAKRWCKNKWRTNRNQQNKIIAKRTATSVRSKEGKFCVPCLPFRGGVINTVIMNVLRCLLHEENEARGWWGVEHRRSEQKNTIWYGISGANRTQERVRNKRADRKCINWRESTNIRLFPIESSKTPLWINIHYLQLMDCTQFSNEFRARNKRKRLKRFEIASERKKRNENREFKFRQRIWSEIVVQIFRCHRSALLAFSFSLIASLPPSVTQCARQTETKMILCAISFLFIIDDMFHIKLIENHWAGG